MRTMSATKFEWEDMTIQVAGTPKILLEITC